MKVLAFLVLLFVGCTAQNYRVGEYTLGSTLWMMKSGEYQASCYQAYNQARLLVDTYLRMNKGSKKNKSMNPPAVILDIDETLLSNVRFQAKNLMENWSYSHDRWDKWINASIAESIKGSVEFARYAKSRGVELIYLTNRASRLKEGTFKNLQKRGFPIKPENLLMKTKSGNKAARRKHVGKKFEIILYLGDDLGDFPIESYKRSNRLRKMLVEENRGLWGIKYIVLPNPMHGSWENAIYDYKWNLSEKQKQSLRLKSVRPLLY